jgi:aromatic ring-opening dioxygenase catalytic subunit (LigB family)
MKLSKLNLNRRRLITGLLLSAWSIFTGKTIGTGAKSLAQTSLVQNNPDQQQMPTLYIPHGGGPCFFMEWTMGPADTWHGMAAWLKQLASSLPKKPTSILVISAHWEEPEITINSSSKPVLLYDYYGFPEHTYQLKYDAPGSPELAKKIHALFGEAKIHSRFEQVRGLDHGVFIPLKLIYPEADIPIVQVSLKKGLIPSQHIEFGRALTPLREQGVLIIGSGMSYHNFSEFGTNSGAENSIAFDNWLTNSVCNADIETRDRLLSEWEKAPSARAAHPREEHLIPLLVAAGAAGNDIGKRIYSERVGNIAISGFQFG